MKRTIALIGINFLIVVIFSVFALAGDKSLDLTIVYSNNINGYVQPCPT